MNATQMSSWTLKKGKLLIFSLVILLAACSKQPTEPTTTEVIESPLAVPYSMGPTNPPEVAVPNSNPPA